MVAHIVGNTNKVQAILCALDKKIVTNDLVGLGFLKVLVNKGCSNQ